MDSIDINIDNYSITELEDLLSLQQNYNVNMIQFQQNDLQTKVIADSSISFESRKDLNEFIDLFMTYFFL